MRLDEDSCYRAIASRDRRFEGRFVVAVTSTGVYCRPGCPARIPRRKNTRFYPCPAAAEDAGFRPCLRCRPDSSPHTPGGRGTSTTVSRAIRLIAVGALDEQSLEDLATRLGIGDRHLRRLFARHVGASPLSLARTRRAHFARKLLDETDLPVGQIASSAGFRSLRRFNGVMRETFGRCPRDLRRMRRLAPHRGEAMALRVPFKPPLDWDRLLNFLRARAIPGVEHVDVHSYRRTIAWGGWVGTLEVTRGKDDSSLLLRVQAPPAGMLMPMLARVNQLFDLEADPRRIAEHLSTDRDLRSRLRARPGLRVPGAWDPFELAIRAVLGQQISVKAASTLAGRLVSALGLPLPQSVGELTAAFPTPEVLAQADVTRIGLTRARAAALHNLATAVSEGRIRLDGSQPPGEVMERLEELGGIGPWTAQYIAMRALRDPDAFPAHDLWLRRALANGAKPLSARELVKRAEAWRPWRSYAAIHLWTEAT